VSDRPIEFGDKLSALCAMELADAHGDADRIGAMIERLTNAVAFTVAIAARGDPKGMETMLQGAESYLYEAASGHGKMGKFMAGHP
jgi:hypothetical protein